MPVDLPGPVGTFSATHPDDAAVEYRLHPQTTRVRVLCVGSDARLHCGDREPEGQTIGIGAQYWPLDDGVLGDPIRWISVEWIGTRSPATSRRARVAATRSIFLALVEFAGGDVHIVCDRGF